MTIVNCPKCTQQLNLEGIQPGTVFQCPCGTKLKAPQSPPAAATPAPTTPTTPPAPAPTPTPAPFPSPAQNPAPNPAQNPAQNPAPTPNSNLDPLFGSNPATENADPLGLGSLPSNQQPPAQAYSAPQPAYQPLTATPPQPLVATPPGPNPAAQTAAAVGSSVSEKEQLETVNRGARIVFVGLITFFASGLLSGFVPALHQVESVVEFGAKVAILIGFIFTLHAPPETDSKKFTILAIVFIAIGGLAMDVSFLFLIWMMGLLENPFLIYMVIHIAWWLPEVGIAFYLLALRQIAMHTKQQSIADEASHLAVILFALAGVEFVIGSIIFKLSLLALLLMFWLFPLYFIAIALAYGYCIFRFFGLMESLEFKKRKKRARGNTGAAWNNAR